VQKPSCVLTYNTCMGGIDLVDQQLDTLLAIRKSYKWYKKVFFRILLHCMLSAHTLMQGQVPGRKHDFLKFVHDAVTQMLSFAPRLNRSASGLDSIARLTGRTHFPSRRPYEGTGSDRKAKSKKCRVCSARGCRTPKGAAIKTTWVCEREVARARFQTTGPYHEQYEARSDVYYVTNDDLVGVVWPATGGCGFCDLPMPPTP